MSMFLDTVRRNAIAATKKGTMNKTIEMVCTFLPGKNELANDVTSLSKYVCKVLAPVMTKNNIAAFVRSSITSIKGSRIKMSVSISSRISPYYHKNYL